MRKIAIALVGNFFMALLLTFPINAGELTLVKVSAQDQRAVIKDDAGNLKLIKIGDNVEQQWKVIGIADKKVILRKKEAAKRTIKVLKIKEHIEKKE
jgi:hypothetical protein